MIGFLVGVNPDPLRGDFDSPDSFRVLDAAHFDNSKRSLKGVLKGDAIDGDDAISDKFLKAVGGEVAAAFFDFAGEQRRAVEFG